MDRKTIREKDKYSHIIFGRPAGGCSDRISAQLDMFKKMREDKELDAEIEEKKQLLESLQTQKLELQKELDRDKEKLRLDLKTLQKVEDADQAAERAEKEKKKWLQSEEEWERLKEEYAQTLQRKEELQRDVERHAVYYKFMEQWVKMTKFHNVPELANHLENLLHIREQLCQRDIAVEQQVRENKTSLSTLKKNHHLENLQMISQLSQLQTELERTHSEALKLERVWDHIQETEAKKTLQLVELKMAALNLYEMTHGDEDGEEAVDMKDTVMQLDEVKMFLLDHNEILRKYQTTCKDAKMEK